MTALLKRDFYTIPIYAYILYMVGIILGYTFFQLPVTLMAIVAFVSIAYSPFLYDRQNHVNHTFVSLPVSRRKLVSARYLYTGMALSMTILFIVTVMTLASFFSEGLKTVSWQGIIFFMILLLLLMSITLPQLYLYSVYAATFSSIVLLSVMFTMVFTSTLDAYVESGMEDGDEDIIFSYTSQSLDTVFSLFVKDWSLPLLFGMLALGLALFYLSYRLSVYIFERKDVVK